MMVETWLRFPFRQQQGMAVFVDRWFIEDDGVPDNQYVSEIPVERLVLNRDIKLGVGAANGAGGAVNAKALRSALEDGDSRWLEQPENST